MAEIKATSKPGAILTKRQQYENLRQQLDLERVSFVTHWKDLNDYIRPRRGRFMVTDVNRGERRSQKVIDSTATFAARTCASGMHAGITSPARPWFRLTTPDPALNEHGPVKEWLDEVRERMAQVFLRSNLYNALPIIYGDLAVFGTAAMALMEDDESVIRCYAFPVGSYHIGLDEKGRVRVFLREFRMTVRQLISRFGMQPDGTIDWTKFSPQVMRYWENGQTETWIDVVHVITPNAEHNPRYLEAKYKAFSSCYYERGQQSPSGSTSPETDDRFLEESGFSTFPILVPRWDVTGEDSWATDCPGMTALGDIRELQTLRKRGAQALDKMVNPPMVADPDMRGNVLNSLPGGISWVRDPQGKAYRPAYQIQIPFDQLNLEKNTLRNQIRESFYADLFLMLEQLDRRQITAAEIYERKEEKLLALGPLLEGLNQDLLDPLIERVFQIMLEKDLLPEPPPELQGANVSVEYMSIMHQAQKAAQLQALNGFVSFVAQLAQIDPSAIDVMDTDELIEQYADAGGVSPKLLRTEDAIAAIRQQRQQQQAAQQQMAMLHAGAQSAKNLAGADTSGKNALTDLTQALGGGGTPGTIPGIPQAA